MRSALCAALLASLACAQGSSADLSDDYELLPQAPTRAAFNITRYATELPKGTYSGGKIIVNLAQGDARAFSMQLQPNGCQNYNTISETSAAFPGACHAAINGGFFSTTWKHGCIGGLVVNGSVKNWETDTYRAMFGRYTMTNDSSAGGIVVGFLRDANKGLPAGMALESLVTGWGWLVRNGQPYINASRDVNNTGVFLRAIAPRTGLGVKQDGTVMLMVIDGWEDPPGVGAKPDGLMWALLQAGAWHAINLDGGGSSAMSYRHKTYSRPTCYDASNPVCERNVSSIACLSQ